MTRPILPGATIGVVGGGQLGRMMAMEAQRMGYRVLTLDPDARSPAALTSSAHIAAELDDPDAVRQLAERSDVVTLEWENASVEALRAAERFAPVRPGPHLLSVAQHRGREKEVARRLGLETAEFRLLSTARGLSNALGEIGTPAVLKTCRGGYDGKGQVVIRTAEEAPAAFNALGAGERELILERLIPFRMEVSVVCARGIDGEIAAFPVGENIHTNGILDTTVVPARISSGLQDRAREVASTMVEGLDLVGVLGVEMFVDENDHLLVNEIAPRPHNSGHYTWEACAVSQFEQQVRAVCGLPLGSVELLRPAAMINLLGEDVGTGEDLAAVAEALRIPGLAIHLYGKDAARTGRKMGHITAIAATADEALGRATEAKRALTASS